MFKKAMQKFLVRGTGIYINTLSFIAPRLGGDKAIRVFCTPRTRGLSAKDEAILAGFSREQLEYNGCRVQCYVKGTGPIVILLAHGWERNAARWKYLFDMLDSQKQFRIVAIDGPAHGLSGSKQLFPPLYAQFIKKACDHYQPQILIGHSIGAASMVYYLTHLETQPAEKLVLMGFAPDFPHLARNFIALLKLNNRSVRAMMNRFKHIFKVDPEAFFISHFTTQLNIPGMVIHGTDDSYSPFANAQKIAENWKGSKLVAIKDGGHSLNNAEVMQKIMQFVSG
jgi:pimeloyl-ACP methyl ester carboxylesterase